MMDMATSPLPATRSSSPAVRIPSPAVAARDALYLVAGLPAGIVAFSVLVTGLSLAGGLAITLLGIPVAVATLYAARAMGDVERVRAGWLLRQRVTRSGGRWSGGPWAHTKAALTDVGAWRDTVWGLVLLPLGILGFTVAVTLWSTVLGLVTSPLWFWALPDDDGVDNATLDFLNNTHDVGPALARIGLGIVLVPVAALLCRALADATARAARALLDH
jgi:Putative sensor